MRQRKGNCQYFQILEEEGHNDSTPAMPRSARSAALLLMQIRPSSRNRVSAVQWLRA